ncbi:DUF4112 domain-containing protein [Haloglomus halophilum]|uniref:DUF4112 domain-containing protein n=1 Tax=Haloglomus halophilum TaxID=2962672 RepID=UPI0020C9E475|nr:DUF4112 domain-containing protein [Haloglomus halophilum]
MDDELPADVSRDAIAEMDAATDIDEAAIRRMHAVVRLLDDGIRLPVVGVRVGLDPIVGVLPVAGDTAMAVVGLYIVAESARQGVSFLTIARMLLNILIDATVGSIPVVGDLFDVAFRAHRRNLDLALADLGVTLDLED